MMYTEEECTHFQFHAPQKGSYLLDVFAAVYPTFEQCQREEPVKYVNVCRFRINCRGMEKVREEGYSSNRYAHSKRREGGQARDQGKFNYLF